MLASELALSYRTSPGIGDGRGSLECCSPWDHKESDRTEQLNWIGLLTVIEMFCVSTALCLCYAWNTASSTEEIKF